MPSGAPRHAKAAYLLARVGRTQSVRFAERVQSIGLRPKHFAVLNAISLADGASQQEIGGRMGLDPSGLVGAIDELERMGLVERRRDPADARVSRIRLTAHGRTLVTTIEAKFGTLRHEMLDGVSDDDLAVALRVAEQLAARFAADRAR